MATFEKKILRRISKGIRMGDKWIIRYKNELYDKLKEPNIDLFIRITRLRLIYGILDEWRIVER